MLPAGAAPEIRPAAAGRPASAPSRSPPTCATSGDGAPDAASSSWSPECSGSGSTSWSSATPPAASAGWRGCGGLARRNGADQHARDHRDPGARRGPRPAARGGRAGRLHARRPQGQARADRQARRARRGRIAGPRLLQQAGQSELSDVGVGAALAGAQPDGRRSPMCAATPTAALRLYGEADGRDRRGGAARPGRSAALVRSCPERLLCRRHRPPARRSAGAPRARSANTGASPTHGRARARQSQMADGSPICRRPTSA